TMRGGSGWCAGTPSPATTPAGPGHPPARARCRPPNDGHRPRPAPPAGTRSGSRWRLASSVGGHMKLVIQIPCLDEEAALPATLKALPREVEGFDAVEWLVIDDGSTDRTVEVARENGVDHIVRLPTHKGLAVAFQAGIDASLKLGADVIVNTDADGQYDPDDIPRLVAPILAAEADPAVETGRAS